jgi:RNA polymerase sigma-70 factor (ECF subfamily)
MEADLDIHLAGIAAGDAHAFARWVAGGEPPLRAALRGFAAAVDVEAVLQEALLRVWQLAPGFHPDGAPNALLRYAHRIAHNLAVSECRRRRAVPDEEAVATLRVESLEPDPLLRQAIADCREKLPGKPAAALNARIGGDGSDATLAARLNMTLNTFLQNFTRARKLLAECLERRGVRLELR